MGNNANDVEIKKDLSSNENNLSSDTTVSKNEKKSKRGIRIFLIIVVIILLFFTVKRLMYVEEVDAINIPSINVLTPVKKNISSYISVMGTIEPGDVSVVTAKVAGNILKVYVKNGDMVKEGDKICEIDNQKQIDSAFIQYDTMKKTYERMKKLYSVGDISLQSFEQTKAQYDAYKLAYDTQIEFATPVALGDGIIENCNLNENVGVDVKEVLCYITSQNAKKISFGVTERVLSGVNLNDIVTIEKSGKVYKAIVTEKAKLINASTGLFDIKAKIITENDFASGVMAKTTFKYAEVKNTYVLPRDIVDYENGLSYIYVVDDDNVLHKNKVITGISNDNDIEIVSGIDENTKIVSTWNNDLREGSKMNIISIDKQIVDDADKNNDDYIEEKNTEEIKEEQEIQISTISKASKKNIKFPEVGNSSVIED